MRRVDFTSQILHWNKLSLFVMCSMLCMLYASVQINAVLAKDTTDNLTGSIVLVV